LGLRCVYCCAPLTAILLVLGMMDARSMILVTAAITVERLHDGGRRAAHAMGWTCVSAGIWLIYRAVL
jgi:predicted metal-binding membrane protein